MVHRRAWLGNILGAIAEYPATLVHLIYICQNLLWNERYNNGYYCYSMEIWKRTATGTVWLLILLPVALVLFSLAALIDIFHPFSWIAGSLSLLFSFHFWLSLCLYGAVTAPLMLSYAKFNTVKDVVHHARVSAILYPLYPARMLHIMFATVCGAISAWCCFGIGGEVDISLTRPSKNFEASVLNERLVFGVLFGAWLGFFAATKYFVNKEFHFAFFRIQQHKFFQAKMVAGPCLKHSIRSCLKASRWFYLLYYLLGNIPRDALASTLNVSLDSKVKPLNTISGLLDLAMLWLIFTTGSLILFVWNFGNKLLVIFHTQAYTFPVESSFSNQKDQCLCVVIKNRTTPLLKYHAMFDLCQLSQFSSRRRKLVFCLSQPGGRPANWSDVSSECLCIVESLTDKLSAEVSLQTHLQKPSLDSRFLQASLLANGKSNGHEVQSPLVYSTPSESPASLTRRNPAFSSPESVRLWSTTFENTPRLPSPRLKQDGGFVARLRNQTMRKVDDLVWRVNQVPHDIACSLKERAIIGYFFNEDQFTSMITNQNAPFHHGLVCQYDGESKCYFSSRDYFANAIPEARIQAAFADCQLCIWAVEALSRLVASSYTEDTFGVVQKSLPDVFISLVNLLQALDQHSKLTLALTSKPTIQPRPPRPQAKDGLRFQLRATLVSSIYRITTIFREHLRSIPMSAEYQTKLQSFLDFRE